MKAINARENAVKIAVKEVKSAKVRFEGARWDVLKLFTGVSPANPPEYENRKTAYNDARERLGSAFAHFLHGYHNADRTVVVMNWVAKVAPDIASSI